MTDIAVCATVIVVSWLITRTVSYAIRMRIQHAQWMVEHDMVKDTDGVWRRVVQVPFKRPYGLGD